MPRRRRQKGGLGPFAQQMALYSLAPLATQVVGSVLGNLLPGLGEAQGGGGGAFSLPGNAKMIGLPNHLPSNTYYRLPRPSQKGGWVLPKKRTRRHPTRRPPRRRRRQRGGIGPLGLMAGMSLAPMVIKALFGGKR